MNERIVGQLRDGEDHGAVAAALRDAPGLVLNHGAKILIHADHIQGTEPRRREELRAERVELLRRGRLKRFVFALDTQAGPRIIKIAQPLSVGAKLRGMMGGSASRTEERLHRRGEAIDVAHARGCGFLELRRGLSLVRSCQVQVPVPADHQTLDTFFGDQLQQFGAAAVEPLANAFAQMHSRGFFHADLKGFHAFPVDLESDDGQPATYRLRWIDLGRVGFHLSRRQRLINLYQIFRFVLPQDAALQEQFMAAYCHRTGWRTKTAALRQVRKLLAHKLRTHPDPFL